MTRRDLKDVLLIERQGPSPHWTEENFLACMRQRNCSQMVAKHHGKIIGFTVYELLEERLKIINLAIETGWRRQGIGGMMVGKLIKKLRGQYRHSIELRVRESNLAAQKFFQTKGFKGSYVIRNDYDDTGEDAYVMKFQLCRLKPEACLPSNRISNYLVKKMSKE